MGTFRAGAGDRRRVRPTARAVAVASWPTASVARASCPACPSGRRTPACRTRGSGSQAGGFAGGASASSPVAGRLVGTVGSRPVVVAAATVLGASLWLAGAAPQPVVLAATLALIGAADAAMDIAMNANAGAYEALSGRSVMHRLHGLWSLGARSPAPAAAPRRGRRRGAHGPTGTDGGGDRGGGARHPGRPGGGRARRTRRRPGGRPGYRPLRLAPGDAGRALPSACWPPPPSPALLEGRPTDWSALRLERLGTGPGVAALGVAATMAGMIAGRATGDHLTERFGGRAVLRGGMGLVAAGLFDWGGDRPPGGVHRRAGGGGAPAPAASSRWRSRRRHGCSARRRPRKAGARRPCPWPPASASWRSRWRWARWPAAGLLGVPGPHRRGRGPRAGRARIVPDAGSGPAPPRWPTSGLRDRGRRRQATVAMPPSTGMTAPVR